MTIFVYKKSYKEFKMVWKYSIENLIIKIYFIIDYLQELAIRHLGTGGKEWIDRGTLKR